MPRVAVRTDAVVSREIPLEDLELYRRELTGYCYRMLGSSFDAEDAVQETMVRAWRGSDSFEGRAAARSWIYRIATNVCVDMLRSRQRRAVPMDMGPATTASATLRPTLPEHAFVMPIPDAQVSPAAGDPADVVMSNETIKLAFVAALQHLPARQRAVLILREVLQWQATEVAELLQTSAASVNSALQRARATLAAREVDDESQPLALAADQQALLQRYVDAFQNYDISRLVNLLHDDVIQSMPPYPMWLVGPDEISSWLLGQGIGCRGSILLPSAANGCPAFGQYRPDPEGGHKPWALQVIEISGDRISGMHNFLDTRLFKVFGLPDHLPA
jgi:RNA polymerase sigma-70 factor (ECF subfamily)